MAKPLDGPLQRHLALVQRFSYGHARTEENKSLAGKLWPHLPNEDQRRAKENAADVARATRDRERGWRK